MKQEIQQAVRMDAKAIYVANDVNIYPALWEVGRRVCNKQLDRKGRMITEKDGTSHFRAYRSGSGSRYLQLFATANGEMKRSRRILVVRFALPLGIGRMAIIEALTRQMREIINYIRSLKENTIWV